MFNAPPTPTETMMRSSVAPRPKHFEKVVNAMQRDNAFALTPDELNTWFDDLYPRVSTGVRTIIVEMHRRDLINPTRKDPTNAI
jgi:hypothetical protein